MFKTCFITQNFFLLKPIMVYLPIKFQFAWLSQDFSKSLKLEYFFGNVAFILLFFAVLLYWFDFSDTKSASKKLKNICMVGANVSLTLLLLIRWWESGHFPLSNLYESLIGLSWGFTAVHLIVTFDKTQMMRWSVSNKSYESSQPSNPLQLSSAEAPLSFLTQVKTDSSFSLRTSKNTPFLRTDRHEQVLSSLNDKIGTITAPTALLTSVFATFFLPEEMLRVTTLIPALKSNWLTMHVTLMIFSYAFLLIGSLLSMAYCAYKFSINLKLSNNLWGTKLFSQISKTGLLQRSDFFTQGKLNLENKTNSTEDHVQKVWSKQPHLDSSFSTSSPITPSSSVKLSLKEQGGHHSTDPHLFKEEQKSFWSSFFSFVQDKPQKKSLPRYEASNPLIHNQDIASSRNGIPTVVSADNKFPTTYTPNISQNSKQQIQIQSDICIWLNTTSYRILGLGFPLLTIGILSGAVWANEAWGSYWSWDPKETWALITWLVFAIYFHSRYNRSSDSSSVPASIASIGFFVIWVCYLGVNLLGTGLHSYGWFGKL